MKRVSPGWIAVIILILSGLSCSERRGKDDHGKSSATGIITTAKRLAIEKTLAFTKVTIINPWQGANNVNMVFYLVPRGNKIPDDIDSTKVIPVPLRKIVCMSTTHVAMITALGEEATIAGMSGTGFIYSKSLTERAKQGLVMDVGYEANLNKELILKIMPDITMIYGVGSESSGYVGKIQELGIKVIYNADYLETDPLGKAEWIKLFGALYCREQLADSIFNTESAAYNKLKALIADKTKERPKVLLGLPFKDTWFVSPGNSFISTLISDAGGEYIWKDIKSSVSMPYGLENVYMKAVNADFWLNIGTAMSKNEISGADQRLTRLPCYTKGNLYNNNNRISPAGGNDFWESGTVYPHLILHDLASILHPSLFEGAELFYYRKIN